MIQLKRAGESLETFLGSRDLFGDAGRTAESDEVLMRIAKTKSIKAVVEPLVRFAEAAKQAIIDSEALRL